MPADIVGVAKNFADLERADWPQLSVDGITINCSDPRPQIFYRGDPDDVRTRFTIAHELGHAVLPWHMGSAECAVASGQEFGRSRFEKEADEFAAELLLPTDWVRQIVRKHDADLSPVLRDIDGARVSATAGVISLAKLLPEGWALQINNQPLVVPRHYGAVRVTRAQVDRQASASGSANVNRQRVRWWRKYDLPAVPDTPLHRNEIYELLDRALSKHSDPECDRKSVEGSVSALLGGLGGMFSARVAYGTLLYRLGLHPQRKDLCADRDFCLWLAWKVNRSCEFRAWG